jgi:hypothetical protein
LWCPLKSMKRFMPLCFSYLREKDERADTLEHIRLHR